MPTAPSGSAVLDRDTTVSTTESITELQAEPTPTKTSLVSGRNRVWAALVTFLVVVGAFVLGLFVATWTTNEAASDISTVRMSQPAWLQYRSGEDASVPVVVVPAGVTQAAWQAYRIGERDSHPVLHPVTGTSLDAWQMYRLGERLAR